MARYCGCGAWWRGSHLMADGGRLNLAMKQGAYGVGRECDFLWTLTHLSNFSRDYSALLSVARHPMG